MRVLLALAALAFLATPVLSATDATTHAVAMRNSRYDPLLLQIQVGDTVTWTHFDAAHITHTVTAFVGGFASPEMGSGQTFTHTFTEPGVVAYHCLFHAAMNGVIVVES